MKVKGFRFIVPVLILLFCSQGWTQRVGDFSTAGYDAQRTGANPNAGNLNPPLGLVQSIPLPSGLNPSGFLVFEGSILLGEGGASGRYLLIDRTTGTVRWEISNPAPGAFLDFVPAYSNDIVLLGGATSSFFQAVQVNQGTRLWADNSLGLTVGHNPVLLNQVAVYSGVTGVVAADAADGTVFWRFPATGPEDEVLAGETNAPLFLQQPASTPWDGVSLAQTPLAVDGGSVYVLLEDGSLASLNLVTGQPNWVTFGVGSDGSHIIPSGGLVFVSNPANGNISALRTADGTPVWIRVAEGTFGRPAMGLAYGELFVFLDRGGQSVVAAYDPETGTEVWEAGDPGGGAPPQFATLADNKLYFYNPGNRRIRVLDALTGNLLWSISRNGVLGLAAVEGRLYVLQNDRVEVFAPSNQLFMAHFADGQGASTLISLANPWPDPVNGIVEFIGNDGAPAFVQIQGFQFPVSSIDFSISGNSSAQIQTTGGSPGIQTGWIRSSSNLPIRGVSVFQFSQQGLLLFEAGVEDSAATGAGTLFVSRASTSPASSISTAIALANPSDEAATITLEYKRRQPISGTATATVLLEPGAHVAKFIDEFLGDENAVGTEGTLIIRSDIPVTATALRTQGGYQMSSYPVAVPRR